MPALCLATPLFAIASSKLALSSTTTLWVTSGLFSSTRSNSQVGICWMGRLVPQRAPSLERRQAVSVTPPAVRQSIQGLYASIDRYDKNDLKDLSIIYLIIPLHRSQQLYQMSKKFHRFNSLKGQELEELESIESGLNKLEETVNFEDQPCIHGTCYCLICFEDQNIRGKLEAVQFTEGSQHSDQWLFKICNGLSISHAPSLRIFISDICFVEGQMLQVFQTDSKENKFHKLQSINPLRSLVKIMMKLRKKYKEMLSQNYRQRLLSKLDANFMHEKYLNKVIPTYMHKGEMMQHKIDSHNGEQTYVVHKNEKFVDENIEEHKLQENQAFCTVKFKNGVSQIFTKAEFERWFDLKNKGVLKTPQIVFVQAYIKEKQQTNAFFVSTLTIGDQGYGISQKFDMELFLKAENQILVLLDAVSKYSDSYVDPSNYSDFTFQLMEQHHQQYVEYMTYKIFHYLGMVARIFIKHIKINWVLNDIGQIYLQSILQLQTMDLPIKPLKYRLPPKQKNSLFYKDSSNFMKIYMQVQINNERKRKKMRQALKNQGTEIYSKKTISLQTYDKPLGERVSKYKTLDPSREHFKNFRTKSTRHVSSEIECKTEKSAFAIRRKVYSVAKKFEIS